MRRRVGFALVAAIALSIGFGLSRQPASAFDSCYVNIYRDDNWDLGYVAARGGISGMSPEERPAYFSVTWGDGDYSYEEHDVNPQTSFELIHFFTPWSGTYGITVEIGTAGGGYQYCTYQTFSFTP